MVHELRSTRLCPFCGGQSLRSFPVDTNDPAIGPHRIEVIECTKCITAWQGRTVFTEAETKAFYATQYCKKEQGTYFDKDLRRKTSELQLDFVESVVTKPGSLLDVGAGDGAFVDAAISRGWNARGIDLSHSSEHVVQATIDGVSGCFDVITMWDVIEHVENPQEAISKASQRLSENGKLIIETGNYLAIDRIMADTVWWGFHPDHRWFHSPPVIEKLLRDSGFSQFIYATKTLRENAPRSVSTYAGPSVVDSFIRFVKRPHRLGTIIRQFRELHASAERCPTLSAVSIFTVACGK